MCNFIPADGGRNRVRAEYKDNCIGLVDEALKPTPPLLTGKRILDVLKNLDVPFLETMTKPLSELGILSGI